MLEVATEVPHQVIVLANGTVIGHGYDNTQVWFLIDIDHC
jgi:hypothetical protein